MIRSTRPSQGTVTSQRPSEEEGADIDCVMPNTLRVVTCVFLICVFFFSVGANLVVFISVYRKRSLRARASLFVLNLMACDFFSAFFAIPFEVIYIMGKEEWLLGVGGYYFTMGNFVCFLTMSFLNITAVTLERYVAVRYPFKYQRWVTPKKIITVIVVIWLYSLLLSVLLSFTLDPNEYDFIIPDQYYYPFLSIHVLIPIVIVAFAYIKLLTIAILQSKRINAACNGTKNNQASSHSVFRQNMKAAKTVGLFFVALVCVWLPFCVIEFLKFSDMNFCSWDMADTLSLCVTYTNGALNVFIYWWSDVEFRRSVRKMMNCAERNESSNSTTAQFPGDGGGTPYTATVARHSN